MNDPADDNVRLRQLMQIELEQSRADLARIAASAQETESELQAVALRLSAREAELEAAYQAARDVGAKLQERDQQLAHQLAKNARLTEGVVKSDKQRPGLATRAVRKARRLTGKAVRTVRR